MNYDEFTSYLAEQIVAVRRHEARKAVPRRAGRYSDAVYKAVMDCPAFFDRFLLDEGPHNDYNPNSKVSVEAYRAAMHEQIAAAAASAAGYLGVFSNDDFYNHIAIDQLKYGDNVSDTRLGRVASFYLANITFERTCALCGAKYQVTVKAQTYRMISNHPPACAPARTTPVPVAKPAVEMQAAVSPKAENKPKVEIERVLSMMERVMRWESRQKCITGPVIPQELLDPAHKPAYNSPTYRANAAAALRLYADFLKFYEEDPNPKSRPEDNQCQLERMYDVVMRTVFNFDQSANKKR